MQRYMYERAEVESRCIIKNMEVCCGLCILGQTTTMQLPQRHKEIFEATDALLVDLLLTFNQSTLCLSDNKK